MQTTPQPRGDLARPRRASGAPRATPWSRPAGRAAAAAGFGEGRAANAPALPRLRPRSGWGQGRRGKLVASLWGRRCVQRARPQLGHARAALTCLWRLLLLACGVLDAGFRFGAEALPAADLAGAGADASPPPAFAAPAWYFLDGSILALRLFTIAMPDSCLRHGDSGAALFPCAAARGRPRLPLSAGRARGAQPYAGGSGRAILTGYGSLAVSSCSHWLPSAGSARQALAQWPAGRTGGRCAASAALAGRLGAAAAKLSLGTGKRS